MTELDQFIRSFASQFDETDIAEFDETTIFKDLDEWSSLTALTIIAMADDEYSVKITGDDIKKSSTIGDLFEIVKQKK
jgi:acyl carrier protein